MKDFSWILGMLLLGCFSCNNSDSSCAEVSTCECAQTQEVNMSQQETVGYTHLDEAIIDYFGLNKGKEKYDLLATFKVDGFLPPLDKLNKYELLSKEEYLKNNDIRQYFKNEKGEYDEELLKDTYDVVLERLNKKIYNEYLSKAVKAIDWNTSPLRKPVIEINSDWTKGGTIDPGAEPLPNVFSAKELAQKNKYLKKDGTFSENTFDEEITSIFNIIPGVFASKGTFVLAQYDKDECNPLTGEKHKKGELKLYNGLPYIEEIGSDEPTVCKQVISAFDCLTREDSFLNKYDFLDSDDNDK